jgi:hypothetical protein
MSTDDDEWGDSLSDKATPGLGLTKDLMSRARSLNPDLAKQGSTTELFDRVKSGQEIASSGKGPAVSAKGRDLTSAILQQRQSYVEEKKRIETEIKNLQKALAEVAPKTLDRVLDIIVDLDPNMTALPTQEIVKSEASFFSEIGFSARRLIEKKAKRR